MEKPGAVDPIGVRSLMESADLADQKKLSIVVGTQQRWQPQYQELMRRVHEGELGEIVGGQAYWNWGSSKWHWEPRQAGWSDMEWQIRCWPYFVWLSGDHIVEQHLHNMDVINWAIGSHPVSCIGMGGRQSRTGPEFGNIWDHFTVEYEYPNGVRVMSMCSQIEGSTPADRRAGPLPERRHRHRPLDGLHRGLEGPQDLTRTTTRSTAARSPSSRISSRASATASRSTNAAGSRKRR